MTKFRLLQVRDSPGILWAFFQEYIDSSIASFEGDFSELDLDELIGCSKDETNSLRRQTLEPQMDFIVVPINYQNVKVLKKIFAKQNVLGTNGSIIHIQIESRGEPLLIACDNFHDDCTVSSASVPEVFLKHLKARGILRDYAPTEHVVPEPTNL